MLQWAWVSPHLIKRSIHSSSFMKSNSLLLCSSSSPGSNILLARLATRKAKPDGQYFLRSEDVDDFIRDLPVTSLPGWYNTTCWSCVLTVGCMHLCGEYVTLYVLFIGVGPVMSRKLAAMGVSSCGDLQQVSMSQLQKKFGPRTGQTLFRFCRGLDDRPVRYEKERKSVSADMNYNIRFTTVSHFFGPLQHVYKPRCSSVSSVTAFSMFSHDKVDEAECFLTNLSMVVQKRLQEAGLRGRRVTLRVMVRKVGAPQEPAKYGGHGICDNLAR